jgi:adenine-specific DNA-methyltransferase
VLSGLSGLYCYFMALAHGWMAEGGVAGWLIPSEFMDVNYGRALKAYLLREVTLLHIHRFDPNDVQFDDALVSSAVVWFKKEKPPINHRVRFSYGGTMQQPAISKNVCVLDLERTDKWTRFPRQDAEAQHDGYRLGDLFAIKRGLATGANEFFILDEEKAHALKLPPQFLKPILPSTRYIKADEIDADEAGVPAFPATAGLRFSWPISPWSALPWASGATGFWCSSSALWRPACLAFTVLVLPFLFATLGVDPSQGISAGARIGP